MSKSEYSRKSSYSIELEAGDYWRCACGKSKTQPLCDGSHKDTGVEPIKFTIAEKATYILCCCNKSKNPPFCDGSHNK